MKNETLDGLSAILAKQPIIPTYKASDLWNAPEAVESAYEQHVRSYFPLAREVSSDEDADVGAFERKLTRFIKESRAPLGYVTAEYGHGKTSTGLFLWQRAQRDNILAVPPFSFDAIADIITAVAGWARFAIERVRPELGDTARQIHDRYHRASIETFARSEAEESGREYENVLSGLQRLDRLGRLKLRLNGLDYVNFLTEMSTLALEAGFDGLLVVADEVQQYIEHEDITSVREPVADLFDLINTMYTRAGRLACGLIFLLPNKELGFLNQQRGDLVARMKKDRLTLDLAHVFGGDFATRLWKSFSDEFGFRDIAGSVITAEALRALGEIAIRTDLASGPRTVVDVFKLACDRFNRKAATPYGLIDLVQSFEHGQVAFDGVSRLQSAVKQALEHDLVRGKPDAERAVRLMAAFPTSGLAQEIQNREGVREVIDDLQRLGGGDLVALRGGGFDHQGRFLEAGVTLMALRPAEAQISWLKSTIRTFRQQYYLGNDRIQRHALDGFRILLTERLFTAPQWKLETEAQATAISSNSGILLRGSFQSTARKYPDRLVYCRLLAPGEEPREILRKHDLLMDFALSVPAQLKSANLESQEPGQVHWLGPRHARVDLNMLHRSPNTNYLELNPGFEDIVAPYQVNPLLTLSLFASLQSDLSAGRVPGGEHGSVRDLFLPALLSAAQRDLFDAQLGRTSDPPVPAADARFVEVLFQMMCDQAFGNEYVTLMITPQWQALLRQYRGALERIDHPLVKRGQERFTGTKREIADLFTRTNSTVDNFIQTLPELITVEEPFRGDNPGAIRFKLHPLEQAIQKLVVERGHKRHILQRTGQAIEVPAYGIQDILKTLSPLGYRDEEIDQALELLETRQMLQRDLTHGMVLALKPDVPEITALRQQVDELSKRCLGLRPLLGESVAAPMERNIRSMHALLAPSAKHPTDQQLISAQRLVHQVQQDLARSLEERRQQLLGEAGRFESGGPDVDRLIESLGRASIGGLFVDQLNRVRIELLQQLSGLKRQMDARTRSAEEITTKMSKSSPADDDLLKSMHELSRLRDGQNEGRQRWEVLQSGTARFRDAERLLTESTTLLNDKLLVLGSAMSEQQRSLERWSVDIRGELSSHRLQALEDIDTWRMSFQTIQRDVAQYEQSVKETFLLRQRMLRDVLTGGFHVEPSALAPLLSFNPLDPDGSYRLVDQQFLDEVNKLSNNIGLRIEEIHRSGRDMQTAEALSILPAEERTAAEQDMIEVERATEAIGPILESQFALLKDAVSSSTQLSSDAVAAYVADIMKTLEPVVGLFQRIQAVRKLIQRTTLTPDEERANAILLDLGAHGEADFGDFQRRVRKDMQSQDPWLLLKVLNDKSRARVRIQPLRQ